MLHFVEINFATKIVISMKSTQVANLLSVTGLVLIRSTLNATIHLPKMRASTTPWQVAHTRGWHNLVRFGCVWIINRAKYNVNVNVFGQILFQSRFNFQTVRQRHRGRPFPTKTVSKRYSTHSPMIEPTFQQILLNRNRFCVNFVNFYV